MKTKTKTQEIFSDNCPYDNPCQTNAKRLLFVCSAGMLRSPTAQVVASSMGYNARACGSHVTLALIPLSVRLILWADAIIFMNTENFKEAIKTFKPVDYDEDINNKAVIWDIPDHFNWGDTVLYYTIEQKLLGMEFK